uniref:Secreted protein n=1 Tax=Anopheles farauti TaxID=69004 RepID=A0A182Q1J5_9DIPT
MRLFIHRSFAFLLLLLVVVVTSVAAGSYHRNHPTQTTSIVQSSRRASELVPYFGGGRFLFPIEISIPDLVNGVLSTFRYLWVRFQWLFGISDTTIVGAKDPPVLMQLVTPSPALKAVPLAPEAVFCTPIKTVSVEVDDPVRHPYMHKTKRRKKRRRRRPTALEKTETEAIDWDMVALEAWSLL